MNKYKLIALSVFLQSALLLAQPPVILDTDPGYDPDDMGCMAMLHNLANMGECEIIGIVNCTDYLESPLCISAVNSFYNRPGIPVGTYRGYASLKNAPEDTYHHQIPGEFPYTLKDNSEARDAVAMYRELLASAGDHSVVVVIIGTMHNFSDLLESGPCPYSGLDGKELVGQKVRQVVTMGGNFIDGKGLDRTNWGGADALCSYTSWSCLNPQRNRMCRTVIDQCPAPFTASGWEVGCGDYHDANYGNVMTGQGLKELEDMHIIRRAYEHHFRTRGGEDKITRHSNDQCALHFAIRGESVNYTHTAGGKIHLSKAGECSFEKVHVGVQGYIQKKRHKDSIAAEIEALMMGEVRAADASGPEGKIKLQVKKGPKGRMLTWNAPKEKDAGSWVAGYHIYRDGAYLATAVGTQYPLPEPSGKKAGYLVESFNSAGSKGAKASITIKNK